MQEKQNPLKNKKVEIRPASKVLKIVLIVLILFSIAALIALRWVHNGIRTEIDALKDEASAVEFANQELAEKKENVDSIDNIQQIAQEELGLVDPDTVLIDPHVETEILATTLP